VCRSDENDPERTSAGSKSRAAAILAAFKRAVAQGKRLGRPQIDGGIERKAQRVAARCARAAADDADGRVFSFRSSGEIASVEAALRQGLSEAGYVEHRNVAIGAGGRRRYDHIFKCSARSTQPIRRRRTAPQAPPYRIRANADNRKTSRPSLCERLMTTVVSIDIYRTLVSGVFRRKDFGFVVCGENLASVSRFVAGIRHAR